MFRAPGGWVLFAQEVLGVTLDAEQIKILNAMQSDTKICVRSGHARGKDFISAVACLCFLYLNYPSKVIHTAPTERQVTKILMTEITVLHQNARYPLGGKITGLQIMFRDDANHFLLGYKPTDTHTEKWTGLHSDNMMVLVSEASGMPDSVYNALVGILTGSNVKFILVGNPNMTSGGFYKAFMDPAFTKFSLNCLDAPNVVEKRNVIPGQVNWEWVNDLVNQSGWTQKVTEDEVQTEQGDFKWEGQWYRPSDLFRVKVLGMWPKESNSQLIPVDWCYSARTRMDNPPIVPNIVKPPRLGVDVAGMGTDLTVFTLRKHNQVIEIKSYGKQDDMKIVGLILDYKRRFHDLLVFIDTIGEGAGVFSRLHELKMMNTEKKLAYRYQGIYSVKGSASAEGLSDITGEREFLNLRAYLWWAMRDALDPQFNAILAYPECDELTEDLTTPEFDFTSTGKIYIEKSEDIKEKIGRSPDWGASLSMTFYPVENKSNFFVDLNLNVRR